MRIPVLALALLLPTALSAQQQTETAIFAGGCFWCMEPPFDALEGVISTTSGYVGGETENPTYEDVTRGGTGHAEAVQVVYDPAKVSYERLLEVYWPNVNPLDGGGQFCDRGDSYRSAIFPLNEEQRAAAEASLEKVAQVLDEDIETTIEEPGTFWPAEDYHQDYYQKNSLKYKFYRWNCGRDPRLADIWGDVPALDLAQK